MALGIARILTVLSILQYVLRGNEPPDLITRVNLRRYEAEQEQQKQFLMCLQQQMHKKQEPRGLHEVALLAVWQHGGFWLAADAPLMLLGLLWLRRKRRAAAGSGSQQGSSGPAEQKRGQRGRRARQGREQAHAASSPLFGSAS